MEILINIITAIPFALLATFLIKGIINLDKEANEIKEICKLEKKLEIENLMLEKEIKKEIKQSLEEQKNSEEIDEFLQFLQKRAEKICEKLEKEIDNVDD